MSAYSYLRLKVLPSLLLLLTATTALASCPAPLIEEGASCVHQPWTSDSDILIGSIGAVSPYAGSLPLFYIDKSDPAMDSQTLLAESDALYLFENEPIFESTALSIIHPVDSPMLLEGVEFVVISSSDCLKANYNPAEPCGAVGGEPRAPFGGDYIFKIYQLQQGTNTQWIQELTQHTETFALTANDFQPALNQNNPYELITRSLTLNLTAKNIILEPGIKYFASIQHVTIKKPDDGSGKADKIIYAPSTTAENSGDWWLYDYDNTRDLTAMNLNDLDTLFAQFDPTNPQRNNLFLPLPGQQAARYSVSKVTGGSSGGGATTTTFVRNCNDLQSITGGNVVFDSPSGEINCDAVNFAPVQLTSAIHLNGNGQTIRNLEISYPFRNGVGLFAVLPHGSSVENVTFEAPYIYGFIDVGTIAGRLDGGTVPATTTISNVHVTDNGYVNGRGNVGGLVGKTSNATISDSSFEGNVHVGCSFGGGLTGVLEYSIARRSYFKGQVNSNANSGCIEPIGGIVGYAFTSNLSETHFMGTVLATKLFGGIAGFSEESSIVRSVVEGSISLKGSALFNDVSADKISGGIVGRMEGGIINQSYARGYVHGEQISGGIVGEANNANIADVFTVADVYAARSSGGADPFGALIVGKLLNSTVQRAKFQSQYDVYNEQFCNSGGGLTICSAGGWFDYETSDDNCYSYATPSSNITECLSQGSLWNSSWSSDNWNIEPGALPRLKNVNSPAYPNIVERYPW